MRLRKWVKANSRMEERLRLIAELGRRRTHILESPERDLEALETLVHDYEAADLIYAAASLRKRLEWYRSL
jgi:hypothetical protein